MKNKIKAIIKYVENPKFSEDSESSDYLSDGEMLEIVNRRIKKPNKIMTTYNDMIDAQGRYELRSGTWNVFQEKISDDGHSVILKRPHKNTHYVHDSYETSRRNYSAPLQYV